MEKVSELMKRVQSVTCEAKRFAETESDWRRAPDPLPPEPLMSRQRRTLKVIEMHFIRYCRSKGLWHSKLYHRVYPIDPVRLY